jgi:hypothetical protein
MGFGLGIIVPEMVAEMDRYRKWQRVVIVEMVTGRHQG